VPLVLALRAIPLALSSKRFSPSIPRPARPGARRRGRRRRARRSLGEGRAAVSHIVGRDPAELDRGGVARGAIESLAENASDAVVAPALVAGPVRPAGHRRLQGRQHRRQHDRPPLERYRHFGWAAARLDDLLNLPASRLTGLLFAPRGGGRAALTAMWRDAGRHVSPNAGWPEAAMAGALAIRLGGPRSYQGRPLDLAWLGSGRKELEPADIRRALALCEC
jgi:adenosylcobinamide-phosphate synthase